MMSSPKFEPARAIEITYPQYGSAYRIGGRLVLTCAHLLGESATIDGDCKIRCNKIPEAMKAKIVWIGDGIDVALIELPESIGSIGAATFGKLPQEYNDQKIRFQFYGAPSHAGSYTENKTLKSGWKQVEGVIYLADRSPQGLLALRLNPDSQASPTQPGKSPWGGASGAAIVCQGLILAVQQQHQRLDQPNALQAQLLHVVYDDPEWQSLLREHGINPDFQEIKLPQFKPPSSTVESNNLPLNIININSYIDVLNWIEEKSKLSGTGIRGLNSKNRSELLEAIKRIKKESSESEVVEFEILELVVHYIFYYHSGTESHIFKKMPKKDYITKIKNYFKDGKTIRSGNASLSSLAEKSEATFNTKDIANLVRKLEKNNAS